MKKIIKPSLVLAFFAAALLAGKVSAATIIWNTPGNITGDTNVSLVGTSVYAFNFSGAAVPVNAVTFADGTAATPAFTIYNAPTVFNGFGSASAPFSTLSSNYQQILSSGRFGSNTVYLNLNQLTLGTSYQVQLFVNDSRGTYSGLRQETATGGANTSAAISYDTTGSPDGNANPGGLGQYIIGTFVADANYESIALTSPYSAQVNAFQLRDLTTAGPAVPEPSTYALVLTGLGLLVLVSRARKSA